jgi:hypothetical protein
LKNPGYQNTRKKTEMAFVQNLVSAREYRFAKNLAPQVLYAHTADVA